MPALLRWLLNLVPTNPIVVRLVEGGSRRLRHMYIRAAYLAVLIVTLLALLLDASGRSNFRDLAAAGAQAFEAVAYLQIALICILTPVFMAGAIAQESNPRTWDILLTTPMSSLQIVLGQLFGRLFFVLALLLASLPLFAITQYYGGVPGSSVLASYAISAGAALLVGSIAVGLSVNRLAGRRAVFTFYIAVVTYLAITIGIDLSIRNGAPTVTVVTPINPFLALRALLAPTEYARPDTIELGQMTTLARFWFGSPVLAWCVLSFGASIVILLTSSITARSIGTKSGVPWYRRMFRLGAKGAATRPAREVSHNPIAWREASARNATLPKIILRWSFVFLGVLWALGLVALYHGGSLNHQAFRTWLLVTTWTEVIIITLVAINMSATAIAREREDGTLDLLLTTPITPKDYLGGKLKGLVYYLMPLIAVPTLTVAIAAGYVLMEGFGRAGGVMVQQTTLLGATTQINAPVILPEAAILLPVMLIPFIAFCVIVGLQWSLKTKGTITAVVFTVLIIGSVAGIAGLCGWQAAMAVELVGPILAALNPLTGLLALIDPIASMISTVENNGLGTARVTLAVGAIISVLCYTLIVLGLRTAMVKSFDMTTRRLAGNK